MDKTRTRPAAVVHLIAPGSSRPRRTAPDLVNLTVEADDRLLLTVQEAARRLASGAASCTSSSPREPFVPSGLAASAGSPRMPSAATSRACGTTEMTTGTRTLADATIYRCASR